MDEMYTAGDRIAELLTRGDGSTGLPSERIHLIRALITRVGAGKIVFSRSWRTYEGGDTAEVEPPDERSARLIEGARREGLYYPHQYPQSD